jgi:hypothetical protein
MPRKIARHHSRLSLLHARNRNGPEERIEQGRAEFHIEADAVPTRLYDAM